jgi:hypothetical protein
VTDTGIQISETICYKPVQIITYVDDICIVGIMLPAMKETLGLQDAAAQKMGLTIIYKIMVAGPCRTISLQKISTHMHTFERVDQFVYLGSVLTNGNINVEVGARILSANKCHFRMHRHLCSKLL